MSSEKWRFLKGSEISDYTDYRPITQMRKHWKIKKSEKLSFEIPNCCRQFCNQESAYWFFSVSLPRK